MEPPKAAIKAFDTQRHNAKRRGIPFLLTFEEWWGWWQTDDRWQNRGRKSGNFQMARYGDVGPYAMGNIYCATAKQNWRIWTPTAHANATRQMDFAHLRDREKHPSRHPVVSPMGAFPSIVLAAEANGIKPKYAQQLASRAAKGWRYAR